MKCFLLSLNLIITKNVPTREKSQIYAKYAIKKNVYKLLLSME